MGAPKKELVVKLTQQENELVHLMLREALEQQRSWRLAYGAYPNIKLDRTIAELERVIKKFVWTRAGAVERSRRRAASPGVPR